MDIKQYIQEIKNKLKKQGYSGKIIDYAEFKQLYRDYSNGLEEINFAIYVLELTRNDFSHLKSKKIKQRF